MRARKLLGSRPTVGPATFGCRFGAGLSLVSIGWLAWADGSVMVGRLEGPDGVPPMLSFREPLEQEIEQKR